MIKILCSAESHPTATVDTFTRENGEWAEHMFTKRAGVHHARPTSSVQLVGRTVDEPAFDEHQPDDGEMRRRHSLRCGLCGDDIPVRHEKLSPILDVLESAGVSTISLTALRARMSE